MIGPFSFFGPTSAGANCAEHVFYFVVPADFGVIADVEIKGQRLGKVTGVQIVDVHGPSALNEFRAPDGDLTMDRESPLPPATYVRFAYRPDDTDAARYRATTEVVTVTLDDGMGGVITSPPQTFHLPAQAARQGLGWAPRSSSVTPSAPSDVTRLDAFAGSTYLPTGEVVFDVFVAARDGPGEGLDDLRVTTTRPAHGTVVAVAADQRLRSVTDPDAPQSRLVYTPDGDSRIDPWVHTDEFTIRIGDDGADVATVPVVIAKRARVIGADELPYLGVESFSGRVSAPIGNVEGYVMVPSVFVSESIDSMMRSPPDRRTAYGSVVVDGDGTFTYTRDPRWELLPVEELDDSFAIVARGADQWAAVVVPVGGAALVRYPSILDVLNTIGGSRSA